MLMKYSDFHPKSLIDFFHIYLFPFPFEFRTVVMDYWTVRRYLCFSVYNSLILVYFPAVDKASTPTTLVIYYVAYTGQNKN